jgi:hypothetical protein
VATNVFEVRVRITATGHPTFSGPGFNIWHIRRIGGLSIQEAVDQAIPDLTTFYTSVADRFHTGTSFVVGELATQTGPPPQTIYATTPATVVGTETGDPAAPQLAACLTYRGTLTGARHRGRKFFGPLTESDMTTGVLNSVVVTDFLNAYDALRTALAANAASSELVVYSQLTDSAVPVATRTMASRVATLRSRA